MCISERVQLQIFRAPNLCLRWLGFGLRLCLRLCTIFGAWAFSRLWWILRDCRWCWSSFWCWKWLWWWWSSLWHRRWLWSCWCWRLSSLWRRWLWSCWWWSSLAWRQNAMTTHRLVLNKPSQNLRHFPSLITFLFFSLASINSMIGFPSHRPAMPWGNHVVSTKKPQIINSESATVSPTHLHLP